MEMPEFKDETIICKDCGQEFTFTAGEKRFYWSKGLARPKRCKECRLRKQLTVDPTTRGEVKP
jgi:DNA replicative helicase MCM subunit Mcm2 (Cdc46/Mcm family)